MRYMMTGMCLVFCSLSLAAPKSKPESKSDLKSESKSGHKAVTKNMCADIPNSVSEFDGAKKFKGCRLTDIAAGSTYERLGLKVGDIVQPSGADGKMEMKNTLRSSASVFDDSSVD